MYYSSVVVLCRCQLFCKKINHIPTFVSTIRTGLFSVTSIIFYLDMWALNIDRKREELLKQLFSRAI